VNYDSIPAADLFKICVWREGRGEDLINRAGIAYSIVNRVQRPCWWGTDLRSVILKPKQFSSFNEGDSNSALFPDLSDPDTPDSRAYLEISALCDGVAAGTATNPVGVATSYFDSSIAPPSWAATMVLTLRHGRISFYARKEDLPPPDAIDHAVNE